MREWLIRRSNQTFSRPVNDEQIVGQIESGIIKPEDEICASPGYWFSIQEVEEVKKHFGDIHLHAMIPRSSEITSTTNTASVSEFETLSRLPKVKIRKAKLDSSSVQAAVVNPQAALLAAPASASQDFDLLQAKRARVMGIVLCFIFFGTLGLLWLGSR